MQRLAALLVVVLMVGPWVARAQTTDVQTQILNLTQLIAQLQARIAAQSATGGSNTTTTTNAGEPCIELSTDLKPDYFDVGGRGPVSRLQEFLTATGDFTAGVTGYYGPKTIAAVQSWQKRHDIASSGTPATNGYGAVGPRTRAAMRGVSCTSSPFNVASTRTQPSGTTTQVPVRPVTPPVVVQPTYASCLFGGTVVPSGTAVQAYSRSSVTSAENCSQYAILRTCNNGTLSGNSLYAYSSCQVSNIGACTIGGFVIANGESRTFYSKTLVQQGDSCTNYQESRTCTNGTLSGSSESAFGACRVANACSIDGISIPSGNTRKLYSKKTVLNGQYCETFAKNRTCTDGSLDGDSDHVYATCSIAAAKACDVVVTGVGTTTILSGATRNMYSVSTVAYNASCETYRQARTCNDGELSGSAAYKYGACSVTPAKACTLDGIEYPHGTKRNFYSRKLAPSGGACTSYDQERTCTNGNWNGTATYQYAVCAVTGKAWCRSDDKYVEHGTSATFYLDNSTAYGQPCAPLSRTCTNGVLSGSNSYQYASCVEGTPRTCTLDSVTVAHNGTRTFYSANQSSSALSCEEAALVRRCVDGNLSGPDDYRYAACGTTAATGAGVPSQLAAIAETLSTILALLAR